MKTMNEARQAIGELTQFVNPGQLKCLTDLATRSEEREYFRDLVCEYAKRIADMPKTYEQDGKGDEAVVYLHYFVGGCDWWITEKDKETPIEPGQFQAFGLASLGFDDPELGYISIVELLSVGAELDLHFKPRTLADVRKQRAA